MASAHGIAVSENDNNTDKDGIDEESQSESSTSTSEHLMNLMKRTFGLASKDEYPEQLLNELTLEGVANFISSGRPKNIIVLAGAGISTSAGIPDFRSPGTGLYDNLQKFNLPYPQAVFEIEFFKENPKPFFELRKDMLTGNFKPTPCHYFIKFLHDKGLLLRHYTQNIDSLERMAGLSDDVLVEAHGTYITSHCLECKEQYDHAWIKDKVVKDEIPKCAKRDCDGLVKPDIVFFGEQLPTRFSDLVNEDFKKCDLLIIMGTSLAVQPFNRLPTRVSETCPRIYINLEEPPGGSDPVLALLGMGHGMQFKKEDNYRDVFYQSTCDDACYYLADKLGWGNVLRDKVKKEHNRLDGPTSTSKRVGVPRSSPKPTTTLRRVGMAPKQSKTPTERPRSDVTAKADVSEAQTKLKSKPN